MPQHIFPEFPVLAVDDEPNFLNSLDFDLRSQGITNVECCRDSRLVMDLLKNKKYSVVLLDLLMPHISGEELLPQIVDAYPDLPVIVLTAFPDKGIFSNSLQEGAFDCLIKPSDTIEIIRTIKDAWELKDIHKEIIQSKKELFTKSPHLLRSLPDIISASPVMQSIFQDIGLIAFTSKPVLIRGEKGAGKEFLARQIHKQSRRKGKFLTINTDGLDERSFTAALFGHKKGSLPGADKDMHGLVDEANGGTLFLNEIAALSLDSQSQLLRLLQSREYFPLGSNTAKSSNVRIIAASAKNLSALLQVGTLHHALYSRLKTQEIHIPPLRERKEDVRLLLLHFLEEAAKKNGIIPPVPPGEILVQLEKYDFPGNVGEIKHLAEAAVKRHIAGETPFELLPVISGEPLKLKGELPQKAIKPERETPGKGKVFFGEHIPTLAEIEALYLEEILKRSGKDYNAAARLAGLNKKTFIKRLKKSKGFPEKK